MWPGRLTEPLGQTDPVLYKRPLKNSRRQLREELIERPRVGELNGRERPSAALDGLQQHSSPEPGAKAVYETDENLVLVRGNPLNRALPNTHPVFPSPSTSPGNM